MTIAIDLEKTKREQIRWLVLLTLNVARPVGVAEHLLLATISDAKLQVTALELRRELDYLGDRQLIEITGKDGPVWLAELTRAGVDVVEYTVSCEPGIARPAKYW